MRVADMKPAQLAGLLIAVLLIVALTISSLQSRAARNHEEQLECFRTAVSEIVKTGDSLEGAKKKCGVE